MINPSELEKVEFSTAFRGYNADQVDEYVDKVVQKYSEAYNNAVECEKLCTSQLEKIQLLERKIASYEKELSEAKNKNSDPSYVAYGKYKDKAIELRDLIKDFKVKIFNLYQGQIKELQSFEFDSDIEELIVSEETAEQTEAVNESEQVEAVETVETVEENENPDESEESSKTVDELIQNVSESVQTDDNKFSEDKVEETDVGNLIDEISNILNKDFPAIDEDNVQTEPESTKVSIAKKIFDSDDSLPEERRNSSPINPTGKATNSSFSNMFITE